MEFYKNEHYSSILIFPKISQVDTKLPGIREKRDFEYQKQNIRAVHMQIFGFDSRFSTPCSRHRGLTLVGIKAPTPSHQP